MEQKNAERVAQSGLPASELEQGATRRLPKKRLRILDRCDGCAAAAHHREKPCDLRADAVDGPHPETLGIFPQMPAEQPVTREHRSGECTHGSGERVGRWIFGGCGVELFEHAGSNLFGGGAREGDGEHLLGGGDIRTAKELEIALEEEARFAGAGRRFDNEGRASVQGLLACLLIGVGRCKGEGLLGRRRGGLRTLLKPVPSGA